MNLNMQQAVSELRQAGIDAPAQEARLLLQYALGITAEQVVAGDYTVKPQQEQFFHALLSRRLKREPMSHLLGVREFWGREFHVSADVLIPRPDSETLIEAIVEQETDKDSKFNILDLGTGSGCLLLTLLAEYPNARGFGLDKSPKALAIARENTQKLGLEARVEWIESDWTEKFSAKKCEIVVANPPYIPSNDVPCLMPEVANYEPRLALDGGKDGLACYRIIAKQIPPYLADNAIVVLEVGENQHEAVAELFCSCGFELVDIKKDLSGIARCVVVRYL